MIHFPPGLPQFIFRNTAAIVILSSDAACKPHPNEGPVVFAGKSSASPRAA
jgi:hypothetical protein